MADQKIRWCDWSGLTHVVTVKIAQIRLRGSR